MPEEQIIWPDESDDEFWTDDESNYVAYHEAGHAVIAWALGLQVMSCEIRHPDGEGNDGLVNYSETVNYSGEATFLTCFAGEVAARKFILDRDFQSSTIKQRSLVESVQRAFANYASGKQKNGSESDYSMAVTLAKNYFGDKRKADRVIRRYAVPLVTFLVNLHWYLISALAEHLVSVTKMSGSEVDLFIREHRIRQLGQLDFDALFAEGAAEPPAQ